MRCGRGGFYTVGECLSVLLHAAYIYVFSVTEVWCDGLPIPRLSFSTMYGRLMGIEGF